MLYARNKRNALIALAQGEDQAVAPVPPPVFEAPFVPAEEDAVEVNSDLATVEQTSALLAERDSEAGTLVVHPIDGLHAVVDESHDAS